MRTCILLFAVAAMTAFAAPDKSSVSIGVKSPSKVSVSWFVQLEPDSNSAPAGTVHLTIDGQQVVLFRAEEWVSTSILPDQYRAEGIPKTAVSVFAGVVKHQRDQLYVTRSRSELRVYHRTFDDRQRRPEFRLIKRVELHRKPPNTITAPNAGGPRQFPIRTHLVARVGDFRRSAMPHSSCKRPAMSPGTHEEISVEVSGVRSVFLT